MPSANGMDPLLLLDTLTYRAPFSSVSGRQFSITSFQSPLLDLAGIRYIVTPQKEIAGATLVYRGDANVFENPRAFPRFFLVGSVAPAPDVPTAVRLIQRREVDPARVAVVASADQARLPRCRATSSAITPTVLTASLSYCCVTPSFSLRYRRS